MYKSKLIWKRDNLKKERNISKTFYLRVFLKELCYRIYLMWMTSQMSFDDRNMQSEIED